MRKKTDNIEDLRKEFKDFAYIISHDLNAPFRQIQGFAKLIQKRNYENFDEKSRDHFDMIIEATEKCQNLIEELLKFSRIQVDEEKFQKVDLSNLVKKIQKNLETNYKDKNLNISIKNLSKVFGDETQLEKVFFNLLDNSIKFQKENSQIEIEISQREDNDKNLLSISDNGIGIKENFKQQVFEMFRKGGYGEEYEGLGAGLAISKKIINLHGGDIWIESSNDSGTEIKFYLPKNNT